MVKSPKDLSIEPAVGWNLTFGDALAHLKQGGRACRAGWNCLLSWVEVVDHEFVRHNMGTSLPWTATDEDLLAQDWHIIPYSENP